MQRLEMRQGQSLVMTPQLLQAIKLLQLSHVDLAAYVEAEMERNPLLDLPEQDSAEDAQRADPADSPDVEAEASDPWLRDGEPESEQRLDSALEEGPSDASPLSPQ